ncbi:universal stress protein [Psychromonas sp. PT13]|uniref:universal stress protein n=1 Tax=Psychromonas sp. PT13 TaxID=3439547 RepID=UPI003EBF1E9C
MYKNILVPMDLNDKGFSDKAVEIAVWHAKNSDAKIHLLNVLPGVHMPMVSAYFPKDAAEKMKADVKTKLNDFAKTHIEASLKYKTYIAEGKPYTTILKYADRLGVDLIVMPSHKRSKVNKALLGSVASKVVENSPVSVLVVKPKPVMK